MQFNKYLKSCREKFNFTQEQLVQKLFDRDDLFYTLDTNTLSRWERGVTQPSAQKKIQIISLFSELSGSILPCFNALDDKEIENILCRVAVKNMIGNSKEHILNFPSKFLNVDDITIKHLRDIEQIDGVIDMSHSVLKNLVGDTHAYSKNNLKEWAMHPSNLFLYSEYMGNFYGLFFTLRLKPKSFKKILEFELNLKDIGIDDFASYNEDGSHLVLSFIAYNDKSSTLLTLRFYAHLIAKQESIGEIGSITMLDSAKKLSNKIKMQLYKNEKRGKNSFSSYLAPLREVLINEDTLKMLFSKQDCSKEQL